MFLSKLSQVVSDGVLVFVLVLLLSVSGQIVLELLKEIFKFCKSNLKVRRN